MIARVHGWLLGLNAWQRVPLGFVCGALATLAMPPWHYVPLLWLVFPALLWMLEGCRTRLQAAVLGWSFGFGHFALGFSWIANAFYVDAQTHGSFAVPAVGTLSALFGLYIAAVAVIVQRIPHDPEAMPYDRTPTAAIRAFGFALAWAGMEWVRGWLFTGFPWNPLGSVWTAWPAMFQIVSVIGTLGLGVLTAAAAAAVSIVGGPLRARSAWMVAAVPTLVLALLGGLGELRLAFASVEPTPGIMLRLVQPNISQADKWRPGLREQHFMDHIELSRGRGVERVTHVIWGEAAVAYALDRDETRRQVAIGSIRAAGPNVQELITGAPRASAGANGLEEIFNSLLVIRADASVGALYDKMHLVPFGEYLPLRGLIPFRKLTEGTMDFSPGHERMTISVDGLPPFSPLICYEAIFSGEVTGPPTKNNERPLWLLNITNDSWFGDSSGPRQHLAEAQLRAAEEGLPLVRVANTGISAVIDPYGRIEGIIPLNRRGTLDSPLPQALSGRTAFGVGGQAIPLMLIILGSAGLVFFARRASRFGS